MFLMFFFLSFFFFFNDTATTEIYTLSLHDALPINFLQHFNDQSFDVLVQARDYYRFEILTMIAVGLIFQVPIGMVALNRAGILSAKRLRATWRYAVVIIAVVAALLPGVDPVTTLLEMVPLLALYGLSILLLTSLDRHRPVDRDYFGDEDDA